jgi:hypothetical protein
LSSSPEGRSHCLKITNEVGRRRSIIPKGTSTNGEIMARWSKESKWIIENAAKRSNQLLSNELNKRFGPVFDDKKEDFIAEFRFLGSLEQDGVHGGPHEQLNEMKAAIAERLRKMDRYISEKELDDMVDTVIVEFFCIVFNEARKCDIEIPPSYMEIFELFR